MRKNAGSALSDALNNVSNIWINNLYRREQEAEELRKRKEIAKQLADTFRAFGPQETTTASNINNFSVGALGRQFLKNNNRNGESFLSNAPKLDYNIPESPQVQTAQATTNVAPEPMQPPKNTVSGYIQNQKNYDSLIENTPERINFKWDNINNNLAKEYKRHMDETPLTNIRDRAFYDAQYRTKLKQNNAKRNEELNQSNNKLSSTTNYIQQLRGVENTLSQDDIRKVNELSYQEAERAKQYEKQLYSQRYNHPILQDIGNKYEIQRNDIEAERQAEHDKIDKGIGEGLLPRSDLQRALAHENIDKIYDEKINNLALDEQDELDISRQSLNSLDTFISELKELGYDENALRYARDNYSQLLNMKDEEGNRAYTDEEIRNAIATEMSTLPSPTETTDIKDINNNIGITPEQEAQLAELTTDTGFNAIPSDITPTYNNISPIYQSAPTYNFESLYDNYVPQQSQIAAPVEESVPEGSALSRFINRAMYGRYTPRGSIPSDEGYKEPDVDRSQSALNQIVQMAENGNPIAANVLQSMMATMLTPTEYTTVRTKNGVYRVPKNEYFAFQDPLKYDVKIVKDAFGNERIVFADPYNMQLFDYGSDYKSNNFNNNISTNDQKSLIGKQTNIRKGKYTIGPIVYNVDNGIITGLDDSTLKLINNEITDREDRYLAYKAAARGDDFLFELLRTGLKNIKEENPSMYDDIVREIYKNYGIPYNDYKPENDRKYNVNNQLLTVKDINTAESLFERFANGN